MIAMIIIAGAEDIDMFDMALPQETAGVKFFVRRCTTPSLHPRCLPAFPMNSPTFTFGRSKDMQRRTRGNASLPRPRRRSTTPSRVPVLLPRGIETQSGAPNALKI
jgi:hypothetical protein